jgi:hypothetical protein
MVMTVFVLGMEHVFVFLGRLGNEKSWLASRRCFYNHVPTVCDHDVSCVNPILQF